MSPDEQICWVGMLCMSAIICGLLDGLDVQFVCRIIEVYWGEEYWYL